MNLGVGRTAIEAHDGSNKKLKKSKTELKSTITRALQQSSRGFRGRNRIWNRGRETTQEFAERLLSLGVNYTLNHLRERYHVIHS